MNRGDMPTVLTVVLVVLAVVLVLVLVLVPVLMMPMMMGGGMMGGWNQGNWGDWGGNMWWGWLIMLLFWILLIGGVVALVVWTVRGMGPSSGRGAARPDAALEILRQRYARGEITGEQFEQMKRDLTSAHSS